MSDTPRTDALFTVKNIGPATKDGVTITDLYSALVKLERDLAAREEELATVRSELANETRMRNLESADYTRSIERAEAERDAAVKDAERYRHMRAFDYSAEYCSHVHQMLNDPEYRMESLDSVIPSGPSNHIDAAKGER